MKIIYAAKGEAIMVDDADYDWLNQYAWRVSNRGYVVRNGRRLGGGCRESGTQMHREIMGCVKGDGVLVDHWDVNPLNCQRYNLRKATRSQNVWNQGVSTRNTTGFKGVYLSQGQYVARIGYHGKSIRLGVFDTPELAHEFYCLAADMLHGEFANHG